MAIDNQKGREDESKLVFSEPVGFAWRGEYLYSIKIKEKGGFVPSKRDVKSKDSRYLGVFVNLVVR